MTRRLLRIALIAVLGCYGALSIVAADSAVPGVYPDRIVLGQSAKLSGTGGTQAGVQYRDGMLLAFNTTGGVNGRRIELISLDDGNKGEPAVANTRALIDKHNVFALVGYTFTTPVKAVLPILRETNIPFVAPYTGFPELYDGSYRNVFMLRASFDDELTALVRHIDTIGFDHVALIHYNTAVGEELKQDVTAQFKKFGRSLGASVGMQINSKNPIEAVQPAATELAKNCPKIVILGVSGKDAAVTVRALKAKDCRSIQYLARGLVDTTVLMRELGDEARGIKVSQVVPNPFRPSAHPLVLEYKQLLRQRDAAAKPDFIEFEGFIVGKFLVQALRRAGRGIDRKSFVQAIEAERLDGPGHYRIQFGPEKRVGSQYVNLVMISGQGRITD